MANKNNDIVIVGALRTPFGRPGGSLSDLDYYDLGAIPIREVLKRVNLPGEIVGEVFWGVGDTSICKDPFTPIAARQSLIKAGLPHETSSISFDMSGVSAMHAVKLAAMAMKLGEIDCAIAGGATSFSRNSLVASAVSQNSLNSRTIKIEEFPSALDYKDFNPAAMDCDRLAAEYGVDRTEQDEWAYRSHIHYGNAWKAGKFEEEILPLPISRENSQTVILNIDEQYKPNVTLDELAKFKHRHGIKTVTAANGAAMSDGASAILLMNREKALETGLQPLATVIANVSLAINLTRMPEAPGFAIQMACKKAGFTLDNMDIIEINEDFACVPLIALRIVAGDNENKFQKLKDKTNINGSSIAIGHPVTASGARIIMNLMYELRRRGGGYALGTLCGGLAQADACIIKVD